jgi:hypothetical protein
MNRIESIEFVGSDQAPQKLSPAKIAVAAGLAVVGVCIIAASMKMSDRATMAAMYAAEAPNRFLATELGLLKVNAMSGESRVAARLYFGIEECFRSSHPIPFDQDLAHAVLIACARNQLGALHAAGGPVLEKDGESLLRKLGLLQ